MADTIAEITERLGALDIPKAAEVAAVFVDEGCSSWNAVVALHDDEETLNALMAAASMKIMSCKKLRDHVNSSRRWNVSSVSAATEEDHQSIAGGVAMISEDDDARMEAKPSKQRKDIPLLEIVRNVAKQLDVPTVDIAVTSVVTECLEVMCLDDTGHFPQNVHRLANALGIPTTKERRPPSQAPVRPALGSVSSVDDTNDFQHQPGFVPPELDDSVESAQAWLDARGDVGEPFKKPFADSGVTGVMLADPSFLSRVSQLPGVPKRTFKLTGHLNKFQSFLIRLPADWRDIPALQHAKWVQCLGVGGQGAAHAFVDSTSGVKYVIKFTNCGGDGPDGVNKNLVRAQREAAVLQRLQREGRGRHIIDVYAFGENAHGDFWMVCEFCTRGDLSAVLKNDHASFTEIMFWDWIVQILSALQDIHESLPPVIHRDLKPLNIFLDADGTIKLGDFGIAKALGVTTLTATGGDIGTLGYMAPEIAAEIAHEDDEEGMKRMNERMSAKADIWSLGAIMYYLIFRQKPGLGNTAWMTQAHLNPSIVERKVAQMSAGCVNKGFSQRCMNAIKITLQYVPAERPTARQLLDAARQWQGEVARGEVSMSHFGDFMWQAGGNPEMSWNAYDPTTVYSNAAAFNLENPNHAINGKLDAIEGYIPNRLNFAFNGYKATSFPQTVSINLDALDRGDEYYLSQWRFHSAGKTYGVSSVSLNCWDSREECWMPIENSLIEFPLEGPFVQTSAPLETVRVTRVQVVIHDQLRGYEDEYSGSGFQCYIKDVHFRLKPTSGVWPQPKEEEKQPAPPPKKVLAPLPPLPPVPSLPPNTPPRWRVLMEGAEQIVEGTVRVIAPLEPSRLLGHRPEKFTFTKMEYMSRYAGVYDESADTPGTAAPTSRRPTTLAAAKSRQDKGTLQPNDLSNLFNDDDEKPAGPEERFVRCTTNHIELLFDDPDEVGDAVTIKFDACIENMFDGGRYFLHFAWFALDRNQIKRFFGAWHSFEVVINRRFAMLFVDGQPALPAYTYNERSQGPSTDWLAGDNGCTPRGVMLLGASYHEDYCSTGCRTGCTPSRKVGHHRDNVVFASTHGNVKNVEIWAGVLR